MDHQIELIRIGEQGGSDDLAWARGRARRVSSRLTSVLNALAEVEPDADAVLVLDAAFEPPADDLPDRLLDGPADVWHGGVALGLGDQPRSWDRVAPLSMFSAPVDPTIEVTSWRLSLRSALIRTDVLRQLGGPDPAFETLTGAALDLGLRWILSGALIRHVPSLVPAAAVPDQPPTPADGLRLVARNRGRMWAGWALARGLGREIPLSASRAAVVAIRRTTPAPVVHYDSPSSEHRRGDTTRTVSVVVPTVDRYPYLETVLHQLAAQTVAPHEVFVIDQTPLDRRRNDLTEIEPTLPLSVVEIPTPGQCTARNAALELSTGELVLLLDDDLEIAPTLIADHLACLGRGIDAVSGGVDDATAGPPPEGFRHRRASDVFPAGNTLVRRRSLEASGLFDPAYDHGPRADHDLGMRLHLSGALLVYEPSVEVFHHHAPSGGLRISGSRTVTRAGSRRTLTVRDLPAVTEQYLSRRYFRPRQAVEGGLIRLLSQLAGEGTAIQRLARALVQLVLLPSSLRKARQVDRAAAELLESRPQIPTFGSVGETTSAT